VEESKKFGRNPEGSQPKLVAIVMGLVPLSKASTDVLVTYNAPLRDSAELEFALQISGSQSIEHSQWPEHLQIARQRVVEALQQLKIEDWSLFG
jgi:hypothetical protein